MTQEAKTTVQEVPDPHAELQERLVEAQTYRGDLHREHMEDRSRPLGREILEFVDEIRADRDVKRAGKALRKAQNTR